uniref:RIIa domain-containing protein n=1 Tax=Poecilia latipinna TaxID=48699 RepID=A0A3B3TMB0_9TELE
MIYTLKSLLECSTRAVMLAQPADILKFESQYFLELLEFGKSMPGFGDGCLYVCVRERFWH